MINYALLCDSKSIYKWNIDGQPLRRENYHDYKRRSIHASPKDYTQNTHNQSSLRMYGLESEQAQRSKPLQQAQLLDISALSTAKRYKQG